MRPVAVLTSDWHLSHKPPAGRADAAHWYQVMQAHVQEVLFRAWELGNVPLVVAGDVFHTWNEPAELVTAVACWLSVHPKVPVLMIPGQHDLPYHDAAQYGRSALQNLVLAGNGLRTGFQDQEIQVLGSDGYGFDDEWTAYGGWWGNDWWAENVETQDLGGKALLVAHKYIHVGGSTAHAGAAVADRIDDTGWPMKVGCAKFRAAVFGDNHCPFLWGNVYNHGCLIRRTRAERAYTPEYGILYDDGAITQHELHAARDDKWHAKVQLEEVLSDAPSTVGFTDSVKALAADQTVDFPAACNALLGTADLSVGAKREILDLLAKKGK